MARMIGCIKKRFLSLEASRLKHSGPNVVVTSMILLSKLTEQEALKNLPECLPSSTYNISHIYERRPSQVCISLVCLVLIDGKEKAVLVDAKT